MIKAVINGDITGSETKSVLYRLVKSHFWGGLRVLSNDVLNSFCTLSASLLSCMRFSSCTILWEDDKAQATPLSAGIPDGAGAPFTLVDYLLFKFLLI